MIVTEVRSQAKHCSFGELKSSLIRDKIVMAFMIKKYKNVKEPDLTLEQAIQICRAAEEVKQQLKQIKGAARTSESLVDTVNKNTQGTDMIERQPKAMIRNCRYCGKPHIQGRCAAYNRRCGRCGKYNQLLCVCQNRIKM